MAFDLLTTTGAGGCSAKIPPRLLEDLLSGLPLSADPRILVDISTHDDAGVYKINDDLALVLTTDFFPPLVSDGYEFGQIAATNSISDVYAMGGTPLLAMNIMMFPSASIPLEVYSEILKGGYEKSAEAGVSIIGGHSIDDYPPKYGLAVIGTVHPDRIITNSGAAAGDVLILTKPVGTGIVLAGHRLGMASDNDLEIAKKQMKLLNVTGASVMRKYGIKGATDITGFGLAGHALKMARASKVTIRLDMTSVPLLPAASDLLAEGCIPGAAFRNLEYTEKETLFDSSLDYNLKMLAHDAQTSGGLFFAAPAEMSDEILADLHNAGLTEAAAVGWADRKGDFPLILK